MKITRECDICFSRETSWPYYAITRCDSQRKGKRGYMVFPQKRVMTICKKCYKNIKNGTKLKR